MMKSLSGNGGSVSPRSRWRADSRVIPGLIIALLGVLLTLDNFGVLPIERVWRFWPLILVALGIYRVTEPAGRRRGFGFFLLVVGIAFQLHTLGLAPLSLSQLGPYWPLILVAVGIHLVWRSRRRGGLAGGLIVLFLGAWFQLEQFGMIHFPLWRLWPLILVVAGVSMVHKALRGRLWR